MDAGVSTNYLVDSNRPYAQVIAETDDSNVVAVEYIFGDDLLAQKRGSTLSNYQYDGLGSTRALTDSTGTVTDGYFYDAFGVTLATSGSTVNDYLFTGEQFDSGLNNYYLRARYYDQGVGRFTQQDSYMGRNLDPITLHKYLYANASPTVYRDPSGNMSIGSLVSAMNVQSILLRTATLGGQLANAMTTVETGISLYHARSAIFRVASHIKTVGFEETLRTDKGFANALQNYDEGLAVLGANLGRLFGGLAKSNQVKEFISNQNNNMLIYGPTPLGKSPWFKVGTRIPIGKIKIGKRTRKILLELGSGAGQGGRFVGLGHTQGNSKKHHNQWFRMDWHKADGAESWRHGNYHFHMKR